MPNTIFFKMKAEGFYLSLEDKKVRGKNLGLEGEEGTREWSSGLWGSDEVRRVAIIKCNDFFLI